MQGSHEVGQWSGGGGGWEYCSHGGEGAANVFVSAVVSKGKLLAKIFVSILSNQNISKGGRGCLSVCPSVPHFWEKSIKACI